MAQLEGIRQNAYGFINDNKGGITDEMARLHPDIFAKKYDSFPDFNGKSPQDYFQKLSLMRNSCRSKNSDIQLALDTDPKFKEA
jgi:hypothetical protein